MVPLFFMTTPTSIQPETELSSVNSILGAIGQSPITRIYNDVNGTLTYVNPEISFIHNILLQTSRDVQNEGWVFNTELKYPLVPDSNNEIRIPNNMLRLDISEGQVFRTTDVVRRNGKLYDKLKHSYEFTQPIEADIVWYFEFDDLPSVYQTYITYRASVTAATQLVASSELTQLLSKKENEAKAAMLEYECNQGDYTFFGFPEHTAYRAYQPYRTLVR